jgi:hypothetical protein
MGARSRKRGRTGRTGAPAAQEPTVDPAPASSDEAGAPPAGEEPPPNRYARGRARDEAIRQNLEPLAPGERPRIVTIAAIVAFGFAIANLVATLTIDDLSGDQGDPTMFAIVWTSVLAVAGAGMLARKYWAVLGFQCILGLQIVIFSLALTRVQKWWVGLIVTILIVLFGWLFWKLIRPMARMQMPTRPGSPESTR